MERERSRDQTHVLANSPNSGFDVAVSGQSLLFLVPRRTQGKFFLRVGATYLTGGQTHRVVRILHGGP